MRIKVHWKLTFIFCSFTFLVLIAAYFYIDVNLKIYLDNQIQDNLQKELLLSRNFLQKELKPEPTMAEASGLAARIGKTLNVRATIISPEGVVLGDSEINLNILPKIENHITRPEIQGAIVKGFGASRRFSTSIRKDMVYMAVPLKGARPMGFLRLAMPLSRVEVIEEGMQKSMIMIMLYIFIVTLLLSIVISAMISKPLAEMASVTRRLAAGDFSKKASAWSNDEFGDLAKTFNYMSDEMRNKIENISSQEAKLEAVLSNMFEGVLLTDEKGRIALMNPSIRKLFLIDSPPEGNRPIEVIRNNTIQHMIDIILKEKRSLITDEITIDLPEVRVININGVPIIKNSHIEGAILVFHDITELKRLERIRQDFVANVSHELRTPISSIKGYAETLLAGAINDKTNAKDFVQIIYNDSERLAKLIDDILDLAKIESGNLKMVPLPMELVSVVNRSVALVKNQANVKSISITVDIASGLQKILADEIKLSQVILNLLDNAIKYTLPHGGINITARHNGKFVQVDVSDTGIGIPEKDIPRIFERFYRVDKAHSRELGGTGLGLSIVKHIVQAHGGDVWVKSALSVGSTFSFTIPKA